MTTRTRTDAHPVAEGEVVPRELLTCEQCGDRFERGKRGPAARYCSGSCKATACTERAKLDGRFEKWTATGRARRLAKRKLPDCPYCGEQMDRVGRVQCGKPECQRAYQRERMRATSALRRALKNGAEAEGPIHLQEIAERDEWTCGICGDPVDREVAWPDPDSPSLDHIVPLSRGGAHAPRNMQLAHLGCNASKGARCESVPASLAA